jgi:YggT family protein
MNALLYIVKALLSLVLFVMLLRLLLQLSRADFRNPVAQAIVRLTNWLILPLRRILPPVGRVDTASVVAVVLVALAEVAILYGVAYGDFPPVVPWLRESALTLVLATLRLYFFAIILYALLSLIAQGSYSPFQSVLDALVEPVLRPFRRLIPGVAGLDLSPLWACIVIQAIIILIS